MKTRSIDITKMVATTLAIVSAAVTVVALLLVNVFDVAAFMDIMRAGTLVFIMSGAYLIGYDDGTTKTKLRWGIKEYIDNEPTTKSDDDEW